MAKVGGGSRKIGRNKDKCGKYLANKQRIKNKTRKLKKRVKNYKDGVGEKILKSVKIGRRKEKIE